MEKIFISLLEIIADIARRAGEGVMWYHYSKLVN